MNDTYTTDVETVQSTVVTADRSLAVTFSKNAVQGVGKPVGDYYIFLNGALDGMMIKGSIWKDKKLGVSIEIKLPATSFQGLFPVPNRTDDGRFLDPKMNGVHPHGETVVREWQAQLLTAFIAWEKNPRAEYRISF